MKQATRYQQPATSTVRKWQQHKWQPWEDHYLRKHFEQFTQSQMAKALGVTHSAVNNRLNKLGLRHSPEAKRKKQLRGFHLLSSEQKAAFARMAKKNKATQFKKGHVPANYKPVGTIGLLSSKRKSDGKLEQYKRIKVADPNQWKLLHHYTWEQAHGPIPVGHIIRFRNGDTMDCRLENLQLVSRKENVKLNSNRQKAAESCKRKWEYKRIKAKYGGTYLRLIKPR